MSSNIYKPSPADIKALRERSGAGMLDVRNALVEANGDAEAAFKALREAGIAKAAKLAGRETSEGRIGAYIHPGGQKGVLVEIRCNTDFVANSEPVEAFVKDMCLQIVSSDNTRWMAAWYGRSRRWVSARRVTCRVESTPSTVRPRASRSFKVASGDSPAPTSSP